MRANLREQAEITRNAIKILEDERERLVEAYRDFLDHKGSA
jgi:hypothetical protein